MGTKANPGDFDCYAKAADDEPLFVLRANDPLAPDLVRTWAHRAFTYDEYAEPKFLEALDCARAMEDWKRDHDEVSPAVQPQTEGNEHDEQN